MKRLVVIHGVSGAGKSTLALRLEAAFPLVYEHVHPIGFLKNFLEGVYGLEKNELEYYSFKKKVANFQTGSTYQDILMAMWELFQKHDPMFSTKGWIKQLEYSWKRGVIPITLSLRNVEEVQWLKWRLEKDDQILVIFLSRSKVTGLTTDVHFEEVKEILQQLPGNVTYQEVQNNSTSISTWLTEGIQVVENWRSSLESSPTQ